MISLLSYAQEIAQEEVNRIINTLASDEMRGRRAFSEDIEKATHFIAKEFEKIGLDYFEGLDSYVQAFTYKERSLSNVIGVLPGKSKKDEYVIFSAHYDHIGILKPVEGDSIANGADDDASGTTAVIMLAKYFKEKADNERTLIFVTYTAEERGMFGSKYLAKQIPPEKVIAGVNIEMVGKLARFGKKTAAITGFDKSNFGKIIEKNLANTPYKIYPDPYPFMRLFYRSDNATFARLKVPYHTIFTVQIDKDEYYHTVNDEVETLDLENLRDTIEAISIGVQSIIDGKDTPTRISDD